MENTVPFGTEDIRFRIDAGRLVSCRRKGSPEPAADPAALIREALEAPQQFPPLRLALTPDDRVAVLVDLDRPDVEPLVRPILQHIESAGVAPAHITVIVPPGRSIDLPGVIVEEHDPNSREALAYVATTAAGRRVYLNRTFAEADQAVVLSEVRHDPRGGVTGGAASIFPVLGDAATRAELLGDGTSRHAEEVSEIGWLVGLPFFVHVIAGPGTSTARVIAGPAESHRAARTALRDLWVGTVDRLADIAIATLTGDPARHTTGELAAALTHASLAVNDGGVLVLLTDAAPDLGEGFALAQRADDPGEARRQIGADCPDRSAAQLWLRAVQRHRVLILCRWPEEVVEELFATPLQHAAQVQKLIDSGGDCVILPDANRLFPVLHDRS